MEAERGRSPRQFISFFDGLRSEFISKFFLLANFKDPQKKKKEKYDKYVKISKVPSESFVSELQGIRLKKHNAKLLRREEQTSDLIRTIKMTAHFKKILTNLFIELPKGGDLHLHAEGSIPLLYLSEFAVKYALYWDAKLKRFFPEQDEDNKRIPAIEIDNTLWETIFKNISIRDVSPRKARKHFFKAFQIIGDILDHVPLQEQLEVMVRNASMQNIQYLEVMLELSKQTIPNKIIEKFPKEINDESLEFIFYELIETGYIENSLAEAQAKLNSCDQSFFGDFSLGDENSVRIGINIEVMRHHEIALFFCCTAAAMATAKCDKRVSGLTVDGPQYYVSATHNFLPQLQIIKFLKNKFPDIKITYHALEVNERLASLEGMQEEAWQIMEYANPNRFGHFTGMQFSKNLIPLMVRLKKEAKMVEVSLSTVEATVNTSPEDNPVMMIFKSGIPVTLSSDDEAITHSNLSKQYEMGCYLGLEYAEITLLLRSSLECSFLEGESIYEKKWYKKALKKRSARKINIYREEFADMHLRKWTPSDEAKHILESSRKAQAIFKLERALVKFERKWTSKATRKSLEQLNFRLADM